MGEEFFENVRVGLCGWEGFFGTVLEVPPAEDPADPQVLVRWDHMNDDGKYEEWVASTAIFRVEG